MKPNSLTIRNSFFFFTLILSSLFGQQVWSDNRLPTNNSLGNASTPSSLVCYNNSCRSLGGFQFNYLIVTRPLFIPALAPFINWKSSQGYRVGLVTVEWLNDNFSGRNLAEKMKSGMHTLRRNNGVQYVLLVGDTQVGHTGLPPTTGSSLFFDSMGFVDIGQITPERMLWSYNLSRTWNVPTGFYRRIPSDPDRVVLPSDAYFVEDRNWDPENTGLNFVNENLNGEGQFNASLYLGRWSVRSPLEIASIFQKTQQALPATSIFFTANTPPPDSNLIDCPDVWPPDPNSAFFCYLDLMRTVRTRLFEEHTPWLRTDYLLADPNAPLQSRELLNRLFSAQGIVVEIYHGSHSCVNFSEACLPIEQMQFQNIIPLLEIGSCAIDSFYWNRTYEDQNDSLAEALLKLPTGPAIISAAPNPYMFFSGLLAGQPVGEAFWRSGQTYVYWPNPITLLGDPSLIVLQMNAPLKIKPPPVNYRKLQFPEIIPPDPKIQKFQIK